MWLEKAWRARILPPAVFLKRFFAPEWVFIFGMPGGQYRTSGSPVPASQHDLPVVLHGERARARRVGGEHLVVAAAGARGDAEGHRRGLPRGIEGFERDRQRV